MYMNTYMYTVRYLAGAVVSREDAYEARHAEAEERQQEGHQYAGETNLPGFSFKTRRDTQIDMVTQRVVGI